MGVRAVSAFTGIPENTLRHWRQVGQGPPSFKIGKKLAYRRAEVEQWVAEQEAATKRGAGIAATK